MRSLDWAAKIFLLELNFSQEDIWPNMCMIVD